MGQVRHGSATTTHVVRAAIQRSIGWQGIAQQCPEKRKRSTVEYLKTAPKKPRSTVLTEAEEAMIVAFRRHTLLPMDDCLRSPAVDSASVTVSSASVPSAAWHLTLTGCRGRQA